ncbi:MAG TPA: hypothetical protein VLO07_01940, partial [Thermoanaerobaculia bacterium]|nr:hypothetical protein [Thermoanaerobaculia bacterium]
MLRLRTMKMLRTLPAVVFAVSFALPVWTLPDPAGMSCCPAGGTLACCLAPTGCVLRSCDDGATVTTPVTVSVFVPAPASVLMAPAISG